MSFFMQKLLTLPGALLAFVINGFSKAYASNKLGDPTPRNMGKLNISPSSHIDPLGLLFIMLFNFGWTKPVITDSRYYKNQKKGEIWVALAGSIGNLILAFLFLSIYKVITILVYNKIITNLNIMSPLLTILSYGALINISLSLFFLLPIPPLSGFIILENILGTKYYNLLQFLQRYGFFILILLLLTSVIYYIVGIPAGILFSLMKSLLRL